MLSSGLKSCTLTDLFQLRSFVMPPHAAMSTTNQVMRTTIQLYRDTLRLAKHIGGNSKKGQAIKQLVRKEFEKGRSETDPEKIEALKANAVRGLSNYLVLANSSKDKRLHDAMNTKTTSKVDDYPMQAEFRDL
ncbi:unnamed protein product [Peronospora belbahrii]|uniref:Complex 1 LYR protein domain-containing protein n=1 Tax=Peronospora belbahrii TaxID=622444 RepID=A0ABN8CKM8_9STRA|nr:unnamed protein product [Peronospora belbahrii]